jgi:hypothetical protein
VGAGTLPDPAPGSTLASAGASDINTRDFHPPTALPGAGLSLSAMLADKSQPVHRRITMLTRRVVACALLLCATTSSHAAAQQVEYNWRTGARTAQKLRAGNMIDVRITNLNPVCYNTQANVQLHDATEDVSDIIAQIRPVTAPRGEDTASVNIAGGDDLKTLNKSHNDARRYIDVLRNKKQCAAPRSFDASTEIAGAERDIDRLIRDLESADRTLVAQLVSADVAGTIAELRLLKAELPSLKERTEMLVQTHAGNAVERMTVKLRDQPTAGSGAPADSQTFDVRVMRRLRMFTSVGAFAAFVRQTDYARVNRQAVDSLGTALDSTYSTYANTKQSVTDVISPTVQFNLALTDLIWDGLSPALSAGVAVRGTGSGVPAEPYVGASLAFRDRFVLSAGVHLSRQEKLLITREGEAPGDVQLRAIPVAVTDSDAVGMTWRDGWYLSFSIRP